jgi:hypothetical protein
MVDRQLLRPGSPRHKESNWIPTDPQRGYELRAGGTTFTLQSETTNGWEDDQWTVPVNFIVSHIVGDRGRMQNLI